MKRTACVFILLLRLLFCTQAMAQTPLRAVVFYQDQTWLQEFNIMGQIAAETQSALDGNANVVISCYGIETTDVVKFVQAAIDMQADVLLCNGIDSEKCIAAYARLKEAGIRLILVDGDSAKSGRDVYVGTDNAQSGTWALNWIVQQCGTDAKVAILMPALNTSLCSVGSRAAQFRQSAEEQHVPIVTACETTYDSLEAMRRIGAMLDAYPEINVIYCTDAVSGKAAATLAQERGICDEMTVITYDRFERIDEYLASGAVDVTLIQDTAAIGKICANTLLCMAEGGDAADAYLPCLPVYGSEAIP